MSAKLPGMMNIREQWQADKDVDRLSMGEARELVKEIAKARRAAEENEAAYVMIEKALAGALGIREPVRFVGAPGIREPVQFVGLDDDEEEPADGQCRASHVIDGLTFFCARAIEHDNILHRDYEGRTWQ